MSYRVSKSQIDQIIEDTESVLKGSAANIGVGDQLIQLSNSVGSGLDRLIAEG